MRVRFRYEPNVRTRRSLTVGPLGLLIGRRTQLVGIETGTSDAAQYRLDRVFDLEVLDEATEPPPGFDIHVYAARSFGVAQDDIEDVVLRFNAKAAPDVRNWYFHASQTRNDLPDGGVEVRLRYAGMLELAWHLFTWGPNFEIVAPERLKRIMRGELVRALDKHAPDSVRASARTRYAPAGTTWESYGGGTGQP